MKPTLKNVKAMVTPGSRWECTEHTQTPELVGTVCTILIRSQRLVTFTRNDRPGAFHVGWFKASNLLFASDGRFRYQLRKGEVVTGTVELVRVDS